MCLICLEFERNRLSIAEARNNLNEIKETISAEHAKDVENMLDQAELENFWDQMEEELDWT